MCLFEVQVTLVGLCKWSIHLKYECSQVADIIRTALFGNSYTSCSLTPFAVCRSFSNLLVNTALPRRLVEVGAVVDPAFPDVPCILLTKHE